MSSEPATTFRLAVSPESARRLTDLADEAGVQPEEFLRASIEEWLSRPQTSFSEAASYVLKKNAELYRRLA
jgi:antitoxin FitA